MSQVPIYKQEKLQPSLRKRVCAINRYVPGHSCLFHNPPYTRYCVTYQNDDLLIPRADLEINEGIFQYHYVGDYMYFAWGLTILWKLPNSFSLAIIIIVYSYVHFCIHSMKQVFWEILQDTANRFKKNCLPFPWAPNWVLSLNSRQQLFITTACAVYVFLKS